MKKLLKISTQFFCGVLVTAAVTSFTFHVFDQDHLKESHHGCVVCKTITGIDGVGAIPGRFLPPHGHEEPLLAFFVPPLRSLASYNVLSSRAPPLA
jgi:hypothetical protein